MWLEVLGRHWLSLHALLVGIGLFIYVAASRALHQRRDPPAAIAWVVALTLLPYVALPLYFMFGSRKVRNIAPPEPEPPPVLHPDAPDAWSQRLAAAMGLAPAASYEELNIHDDGSAALRALHDVMAGARHTLDLCTFLLASGSVGSEVAQALMRSARSGVRVRVMVDGVGVYLGGRFDLHRLQAAGIQVVKFVPPLLSALQGRSNLRNHRKMVIADGSWFWCGGRNLSAEYFVGGRPPGAPPWHDLSFDLRGGVAAEAQQRFDLDWAFATKTTAPAESLASAAAPAVDGRLAQLIPSGPDQPEDTFYELLVSGCFMSRRRILAVTPYFVPDETLLLALTTAARRGVAVDLLLPRRSNHRLADLARNRPLRDLVNSGARVWSLPYMIHAKAVVIDDRFALAGSANLDARSLFLNYELMVAFYRSADVARFAAWIERERASAQRYRTRAPGLLRDLGEGLVLWLAFQL